MVFSKMNDVIKKDCFPLLKIDDSLDAVAEPGGSLPSS
jgi:hypothetical protein